MTHGSQIRYGNPRVDTALVIALVSGLLGGCTFSVEGLAPDPDGSVIEDAAPRDAADWDALGIDICDRDGDGYRAMSCGGTDCDDHDVNAWPENPEQCDGKDNDCDGTVDEGLAGAADNDGDGYSTCLGDCDDGDPTVYPFAPDLCDGKDNDCDGDSDGDADCDGDGYSPRGGDCDDSDTAVHPYAPDLCDGKDNNCDGDIDGEADCDGDGFSILAGDCDDDDLATYPWAAELCDGRDNDCDTIIDEDCN